MEQIPLILKEVHKEKTVSFNDTNVDEWWYICLYFLARISINRKNGSLTFVSVISSDHGIYECNTFHENDTPISSRKTNLTVIEQLRFVPQPTSKNLEMGTLGKVHCKVQGSPTPQVKWTKVGIITILPILRIFRFG